MEATVVPQFVCVCVYFLLLKPGSWCVKGAARSQLCSTCALKSFSWRGEVGSSTRLWTFRLFSIWSSFFAFRSSTLNSALLRLSSCRSRNRNISDRIMWRCIKSCPNRGCDWHWHLSRCFWTGWADLRCRWQLTFLDVEQDYRSHKRYRHSLLNDHKSRLGFKQSPGHLTLHSPSFNDRTLAVYVS